MDRLTFLLLLLWVGVTVSTEVELQKRIYNGEKCNDEERLYHVALSVNDTGDDIHCGGSLIHEQWVLTAAHCQWNTLYAVVGVHPGSGREVIKVIQTIPHDLNHDIMLLKLEKAVTGIDPVPLPDNNDCSAQPIEGEPFQIAGYGYYQVNNKHQPIPPLPPHLQCATMNVCACDTTLIRENEPNENLICFRGNNVDTCPGDSGGGWVYKKKLRAVHFGGGGLVRVCYDHADSLDVCKYLDWINNKTKISI